MNEKRRFHTKGKSEMGSGILRNQNKYQRRFMPLADSLREFAEMGSPVDLSVATEEFRYLKVEIQQSGGIHDSKVFELEDGRTGWMLDLEIYIHTWRPIYLVEVELKLPWKTNDYLFEWLTPLKITAKNRGEKAISSYEIYRFPGKSGLELPAEDVINNRLFEKKMLPARRRICGWLLATGGPMPRNLLNGGWIEPRLVITASDHTEFRQPIQLWTERLERRARRAPRTIDLFGNRIAGRVLENTLQTRPSKSAVSKLGGGQQQASN
jgi:hypothetical protein